jgi:hypothetical protein
MTRAEPFVHLEIPTSPLMSHSDSVQFPSANLTILDGPRLPSAERLIMTAIRVVSLALRVAQCTCAAIVLDLVVVCDSLIQIICNRLI